MLTRSLILCLLFLLSLPTFACTLQDDSGKTLTLPHPAQRIISLSPDLTETLFALGAGNSLIAVIANSDYPAAAQKLPRIGDYHALDLEAIIALHPDLIIAWGASHARQLAKLQSMGIPVYISHPQHLLDIPGTITRLACLTGKEKQAEAFVKQFHKRYAHLKRQAYLRPRLRVFYEVAAQPLMTLGKNTWINDIIELCGGHNVFADEKTAALFKQGAFAVTSEAVIHANPQVVISGLPAGWQTAWQAWTSIAAVQNQRLVSINPDLLERPGTRILDGAAQVCQSLARQSRGGAGPLKQI